MTKPTDMSAQQCWQQPQAAESWVRRQAQTDQQIAPLGKLALDALAPRAGEWAIDVGCGAGSTLLELCARVGPSGGVCGVDVSEVMLKRARELVTQSGLTNVELVQADAQVHAFARKYDLLFSRFGVMFFTEPVQAFTNLRASLVAGGRLGFVCWQSLSENPWAAVLLDALLPLTASGRLPPMCEPGLPGPFYFGDADRVRSILSGAGFQAIDIRPVQQELNLGGAQTLAEAVAFCMDIGPAARLVEEAEPAQRPVLRAAIEQALQPFTTERGTWMPGAVFVVSARA